MRVQRQSERQGYLLLITLGAIVLAFMGLSLAITATGTARFAVAMGYRAEVGYAVGAVFDFAKASVACRVARAFRTARLPLLRHYRICMARARDL